MFLTMLLKSFLVVSNVFFRVSISVLILACSSRFLFSWSVIVLRVIYKFPLYFSSLPIKSWNLYAYLWLLLLSCSLVLIVICRLFKSPRTVLIAWDNLLIPSSILAILLLAFAIVASTSSCLLKATFKSFCNLGIVV